MKYRGKLLYHLIFWLLYFSVILFNDLYLSSSFLKDPSWIWIEKAIMSHGLILVVKITAVYYTIYSLVPRWLRSLKKSKLVFESVAMFALFVLLYRLMTQLIIWPYIYGEKVQIHTLSMMARYLYSFLDILQVVGIATAIKLVRLRIAAISKEKQLQQERFSTELQHLKAQVNPHFLFNSLNSIFSLSRAHSEQTPDMILKLSNILRYMLYESEKKVTSLDSELKIIEDYIALQQMRFGERVKMIKTIKREEQNAQMAPLLILPLVENCYKHGITGSEVSVIHFEMHVAKGHLKVRTMNSIGGESMDEEKRDGIGLSNIKRQLELLYRGHRFNYHTERTNFIVDLEIELGTYAGDELFDSRG